MPPSIRQYVQPIAGSFSDAVNTTARTLRKEIPKNHKIFKSPLRYPGGKTRAVKEIAKFFPAGLGKICSPFLGGGSIEIALASKGVKVFAYDIFEPLTDFWQILLKEPKSLAELVRKYYPLTSSKFYSLQKEYSKIKSKKERAAIFFCFKQILIFRYYPFRRHVTKPSKIY